MGMNVGIIGSGSVGKTLGAGFAGRGDRVMLGSREPERADLVEWRTATGDRVCTGTNDQAAAFGELLVFCPRWSGARNALDLAGHDLFAGKVVIDVTNPIGQDETGRLVLTLGRDSSAAERLQAWVPEGRVVKAFNWVGSASMVKPDFPQGPASGFYCGDDPDAKEVVACVLRDFGWDPVDMGALIAARGLEPLVLNWMAYGRMTGRWDHTLTVVHKT
jgi:predicted dinucleotide-binding enzyme